MEQLIPLCVGFLLGYFVCRRYDNQIYLKWVDLKVAFLKRKNSFKLKKTIDKAKRKK